MCLNISTMQPNWQHVYGEQKQAISEIGKCVEYIVWNMLKQCLMYECI